jgi:hypothetical protein
VLSDVDGWVSWNDGIESITLDGPLAVGAQFRMTPPGEDTVTSTIVALEPPRLLSDSSDIEGLTIRVDHRVDVGSDGDTTIAFAVTVTGDAPDEVTAQVGAAISADFPDVMANLATAAKRD